MYNNQFAGFQNPYQSLYNPYQAATVPQSAAPQRHEIIRVNGKPGADAYQMAPNSQILLLDETAPIVWLKTTDGAGYATVTAYDIAPAQTAEQKDADRYAALETRIATLEAILNEQSNPGNAESKPTVRNARKSESD